MISDPTQKNCLIAESPVPLIPLADNAVQLDCLISMKVQSRHAEPGSSAVSAPIWSVEPGRDLICLELIQLQLHRREWYVSQDESYYFAPPASKADRSPAQPMT